MTNRPIRALLANSRPRKSKKTARQLTEAAGGAHAPGRRPVERLPHAQIRFTQSDRP